MAARRTLLEMTTEILQSMQSDIVESITDTEESKAVSAIIRRTYWDMFGPMDLPEHYTLFKLTETSASTPNIMLAPTNALNIKWIKYNTDLGDGDQYSEIPRDDFNQFISRMLMIPNSLDNVDEVSYTFNPLGSDPVPVRCYNDQHPTCYVTPDDDTLVFNSYNSDEETFLHADRSLAYGLIDPTFTYSDSFVPDLDTLQHALLFNESKAMCFAELKQTQHGKAEIRARKLQVSAQKTGNKFGRRNPTDVFPDYGRRGVYGRTSSRPKSYNS